MSLDSIRREFSGVFARIRPRTVAVPHETVERVGLEGSPDAAVRPAAAVGRLPFDHNAILEIAVQHVVRAHRRRPELFGVLGNSFTLRELQQLHEAVTGRHRPVVNRCRSLPQMPLKAGVILTVPARSSGSAMSSIRTSSLP